MSSHSFSALHKMPLPARFGLCSLAAGTLWAFWPTLVHISSRWQDDPQYSHGYLVPAFALALLWVRRAELRQASWKTNWLGFVLLVVGLVTRLCAGYFYMEWLENISLLPVLAGIFLFLGDWPALRWGWPAIAFLFFMMPLPHRLETLLAFPLRRLATVTSTYALQTIGFTALADGTDIYLKGLPEPMQVAPACSGLGMLMVFFALSSAIALLTQRPLLDRLVIVLSAAPIAVIANIVRISLTGALFELSSAELAHKVFHDWAGFLMMPVALAILWLELKVFDRLFIPLERVRPVVFSLPDVGRPKRHAAARPS
jgi:exosortase